MEKRELEFSTRLTREDVAGLIEALVEGLKDGVLRVQKSGEVLELEVPRVVDLEIEATVDEEKAEFEIEVSWRTNRAENPDNAPGAASEESGPEASPPKRERKTAGSARKAAKKRVAEKDGAAGEPVKKNIRAATKKTAGDKTPTARRRSGKRAAGTEKDVSKEDAAAKDVAKENADE